MSWICLYMNTLVRKITTPALSARYINIFGITNRLVLENPVPIFQTSGLTSILGRPNLGGTLCPQPKGRHLYSNWKLNKQGVEQKYNYSYFLHLVWLNNYAPRISLKNNYTCDYVWCFTFCQNHKEERTYREIIFLCIFSI